MDFGSLESFSENDYEALYEEAIDSGAPIAGVYCYHTYSTLTCECISKGASMDFWYAGGGQYIRGWVGFGKLAQITNYNPGVSSCSWSYDAGYDMRKLHCWRSGGAHYHWSSGDGGRYTHMGYSGGGYINVGLGRESHCR